MFQPNYRLTPKLLSNIAVCERLYGQIESLRLPRELWLNLTRSNLVRSSYASNSIEGNPLSLAEVTNLLLGDRLPANRDEKEVANYFSLLKELEKHQQTPFSLSLVLKFHRQLLRGVNENIAGQIRNQPIVVGRQIANKLEIQHNPPFHRRESIEKELNKLFVWVERQRDVPVMIKTGFFHHHFVYLHPFIDGNGRICRLLTSLIFLRADYLINKYFVLDDYYDVDRLLYSQKLHSADSGDKTEWLEYFSDGIKYSLQGALGRARLAFRSLRTPNQPTLREREVLILLEEKPEITTRELAERFRVSRQQAHLLLHDLVFKGLLEKKGGTKASYYRLKI